MTTPIVLCTRADAAQEWLPALRAALAERGVAHDLWWRDAQRGEIEPDARRADLAVVWRPPAALFAEQPALRAAVVLGAGVDAVLALPNLPPALTVVRLEDAGMADAMAEYVLAAVLRAYRGFDRFAAAQRRRAWAPWSPPPRQQVKVGVLGVGAIGGPIARTLAAYGFAVRGYARSGRTLAGVQCFGGPPQLAAFLDGLDVLVAVLPLTAATTGLLDAVAFARLADGAHLINVGRGALVVEADLLAALDAGKLGGATLDVFATEPLPPQHPFWSHPGIVVTPHVSAPTDLATSLPQVADKLAALARGAPVSGVVDRGLGY